ncbi:hypothetical protein [Paludisphaera soli]|uniref:hypothetical protein n=1 Tax=Paludisphaera soli TaxID=2712865 RepID=UPI0013EDD724|nr:hypothetical protein [Paludisphaera soli]
MIVALAASTCATPSARAEAGRGGPAGIWTPLAQAVRETTTQGVPSVVIITSRATPDSASLRRDLESSPQAESLARSVRLAEMPAEIYASQVAKLGVKSFPTVVVYREEGGKLRTVAAKAGLADARSLFAWLISLDPVEDKPSEVANGQAGPKDPKLAQASHFNDGPSPQAYATEQRVPQPYAPPKQPPIAPPQPPVHIPPPQPQQPVYQAPPAQYVPAPPPTYVQTQPPAMVVQQAPQQIFFAPTPPPQVTVAMAPPMYAPQPQPMQAPQPQPNLFTQPMQAPQPQPMQAPQPQPMQAPQPQPMQAPQPQPMQAPQPQPMQAPQPQPMFAPQPQPMQAPVGQAPSTAMVLQAPGLIDSLLGTIGENLARRKNPRIQMSPMPTLAQAPVANAPVAFAPAGQGQAYAQVTGYAPSGPPIPVVTPEATSFAPCNTYGAHCKYHGAPCPGPNPGQGHGHGHGHGNWGGGGGGEYAPPSGPTPSPQNGGSGFRRWLGHGGN